MQFAGNDVFLNRVDEREEIMMLVKNWMSNPVISINVDASEKF